jgi:hypothetical protein
MRNVSKTESGIDIAHVLEQTQTEYRTEQIMLVKYADGKFVPGNGIPVMRCTIVGKLNKVEMASGEGPSTLSAISKAIDALISRTGVSPVMLTEADQLRNKVALLEQQINTLINGLAAARSDAAPAESAPEPERRGKVKTPSTT